MNDELVPMGLGVCLLLVMEVPMARRVLMDLGVVALMRRVWVPLPLRRMGALMRQACSASSEVCGFCWLWEL
jgi:hypothetical protein